MTNTPITVKKVLDSMGGWENIQLCMDADRFEYHPSQNRLSIYYWDDKTIRRVSIYATYYNVYPENPIRVFFVSPSSPCNIYLYCNGTINRDLILLIRSVTGLSLDLL